ncbi:TIGR03862 family flavoprotein [Sessilibacter sp. MAH2]
MSANISLNAVIIGAGPAGLMAAEQLARHNILVTIFDAMPSVGRKFLRAGIGGLNLTHSENKSDFLKRYTPAHQIEPWLKRFDADALISWVKELGIDTFVGSSGRIFPTQKKAAPLLRAWLKRLKDSGVNIETRHRWLGWDEHGNLRFQNSEGELTVKSEVVIFALGGGSWPRLGSDGRWMEIFRQRGINCQPFRSSNCGFNYSWSDNFQREQQGQPLKNVCLTSQISSKKGDATISAYGLEGSLIYGLSASIQDQISNKGQAIVYWDLLPDCSVTDIRGKLQNRRSKDSLSNMLRKQLGISGSKLALLKELTSKEQMQNIDALAELIKNLPQILPSCRPISEAISTAGGVDFEQLTEGLMLKFTPGIFCVGEMLDWDAPTGGYLLTACFASGVVAGEAAVKYLSQRSKTIGTSN